MKKLFSLMLLLLSIIAVGCVNNSEESNNKLVIEAMESLDKLMPERFDNLGLTAENKQVTYDKDSCIVIQFDAVYKLQSGNKASLPFEYIYNVTQGTVDYSFNDLSKHEKFMESVKRFSDEVEIEAMGNPEDMEEVKKPGHFKSCIGWSLLTTKINDKTRR